jgi:MFS family permease
VVADVIGRKRLLVGTTLFMIVELALIAFVPLGNGNLIFSAFLVNRVLSGVAEAMASGADEAMAYDTLVEAGIREEWPKVLDLQMRCQNIGYIFAMTIGAAVYDPGMVNRFLHLFGFTGMLSQQVTMRFPIYLTLLLGILAWMTTMRMRDPQVVVNGEQGEPVQLSVMEMTRQTMAAGRWLIRTPLALAIILFAMTFDHTLRMIVTMTSQYYRLINLPEASFGLIGSGVAVLGLLVPRIARGMTERFSLAKNLIVLALLALTTLFLLPLFIPYYGFIPMMFVFVGMMMTSFFTSYYLNEITASEQRATVLSFKGLAFNAAYGLIGIFYAVLIQQLRELQGSQHPQWTTELVENEAFQISMGWFPWYMIAVLVLVALVCLPRLRSAKKSDVESAAS